MLDYKITEKLKPNQKLIKMLDNFKYKTKSGKVKMILKKLKLSQLININL